jgi:hypothetical protein
MAASFVSPFIYTPEKSLEVYEASMKHLKDSGVEAVLSELGWAYQSVGTLIPETLESMWSGHFVPWIESWEDLQISANLCVFGFYKQAMGSLRSALELGLLSVYWNLNDDGHIEVKTWLSSKEDTPRMGTVWSKLSRHENFRKFQARQDLRQRILDLGYLHDYVHTKGHKFANHPGLRPNFQLFNEKAFDIWFTAFSEVIRVLTICHLVKYPLGTVRYPWSDKFGIDTPSFGGIDEFQVDRLERLIGPSTFQVISDIAKSDKYVGEIVSWVDSKRDMTEQEVEEQIVKFNQLMIEMGGLENWLANEQRMQEHRPADEKRRKRIEQLIEWAKEKGFGKAPWERSVR